MVDVFDRLASRRASFEDWLDCIAVARAHEDWSVVATCATAALESALRRPLPARTLQEAAYAVVTGSLTTVDALVVNLKSAHQQVQHQLAAAEHNTALREVLAEVECDVADMTILASDDDPRSRYALARFLRKYERPELAVSLLSSLLTSNPDDVIALTVTAAALLDSERYGAAYRHISQAHLLAPSKYTYKTLSRAARLVGDVDGALDAAVNAARLDPGRPTAILLAAAAQAAGDQSALEQAEALLTAYEPAPDSEPTRRLVRLRAAEHLARDGQLKLAVTALEELLAERWWREAQSLLDRVRRGGLGKHGPSASGDITS